MPISTAYRLCPQARYMRPNWNLYERASEGVMKTLRGFADEFEQSSIDEAFLDVSKRVSSADAAKKLALRVKQAVLTEHGLTCSIGVGPNKSSAKIASDRSKPDGLTLVPFDDVKSFLSPLSVTVVPGIGRKTAEFLKSKGIETVGQLQKIDGRQLVSWFGKNGVWLWGVVQGQENIEVRNQEMPKSLSVERTFKEDQPDFEMVRQEAVDAVSELVSRVKSSSLIFRVGGVKIRFRGFETHTKERTLPSHTDSEEALREVVLRLISEFQPISKPVRLVGVRVADLKLAPRDASNLDRFLDAS